MVPDPGRWWITCTTLRKTTRTTSTARSKSLWKLRASPSSLRRAPRRELLPLVRHGLQLPRLRPVEMQVDTGTISAHWVLRPRPKCPSSGRRCPHRVRPSTTVASTTPLAAPTSPARTQQAQVDPDSDITGTGTRTGPTTSESTPPALPHPCHPARSVPQCLMGR